MRVNLRSTKLVILLCTLCCMLWGSAVPIIKIGYQLLKIESSDIASQILFAGIRFFLSGVLTVIIGSIISKSFIYPRSAASLLRAAKLSVFQTAIQYVFFYIGLANTTGVKSSILDGTSVFIALILSGLIFKMEKVTLLKVIGAVIGFIGVILININTENIKALFDFSLLGEGFILISTTGYACSSVFMKRYSKYDDPTMLSGYQFMIGGAAMALGGIAFGGRLLHFSFWAMIVTIYLILVSAVAYTIWAQLLKHNPVSKITVFSFLIPVFGSLFSTVMLKESDILNPKGIFSLILVSAGIILVSRGSFKNKTTK